MDASNNTLVKIAFEDEEVRVDSMSGELVVYCYEGLRPDNISSLLNEYYFTGIYIAFSTAVEVLVHDIVDNTPLHFMVDKGAFLIKPERVVCDGDPWVVVSFKLKGKDFQLNGKFIKVTKESICS